MRTQALSIYALAIALVATVPATTGMIPAVHASSNFQINDVYVDKNSLIYANDRLNGAMDIIRYTGPVPWNDFPSE